MTKKQYEAQVFEPIEPKINFLMDIEEKKEEKRRFYIYGKLKQETQTIFPQGYDCDIEAPTQEEAINRFKLLLYN